MASFGRSAAASIGSSVFSPGQARGVLYLNACDPSGLLGLQPRAWADESLGKQAYKGIPAQATNVAEIIKVEVSNEVGRVQPKTHA